MSCQRKSWRSNTGPSAKASAGSVKAAAARPPSACVLPTMNRRRVTVSPSNAPGMLRSAVVLGVVFLRAGSAMGNGPEDYPSRSLRVARGDRAIRSVARRHVGGAASRGGQQRLGGARLAGPRGGLGGRVLGRLTPPDGDRAGLPDGVSKGRDALRVRERAQRDDVGELRDRLEVAELREVGEAQCVEPVAGEQGEVGVGPG